MVAFSARPLDMAAQEGKAMRKMLRTAAPLLALLAACWGDDGTCRQPGSACEIVDANICAERLVCPGFSASGVGGTLHVAGGMYFGSAAHRQRASVTIDMTRLPGIGETTIWTPESTGDFEAVIVERYGDSITFPRPVTHAAGQARWASPTGPARPAQGSVSVHIESISEAVHGWVDAVCPPLGGTGEPLTVHVEF